MDWRTWVEGAGVRYLSSSYVTAAQVSGSVISVDRFSSYPQTLPSCDATPGLYDAHSRPLPRSRDSGFAVPIPSVATDGHRLSVIDRPVPAGAQPFPNAPASPPPAKKRVMVQCENCGRPYRHKCSEDPNETDLVVLTVQPFCACVVDAAREVIRDADRAAPMHALPGGKTTPGDTPARGVLRVVRDDGDD